MHFILHQYVRTLGTVNVAIYIGEPREWTYDQHQDTYTPPTHILRAVGSAVIWMRARFPSINYDYSFAYDFPTNFPHHARHPRPPDDEMPKVEDVVPYTAARRLLDIIRLPDALLQQLGNDDDQAANVEVVNEEANVA